jgi:hypothetical protein
MSHGLLAGHRPPDKEVLLRWLDNAGVYVSPALEVCDMEDGDGWRVVTKAPIQLNEIRKLSVASSSSVQQLRSDC